MDEPVDISTLRQWACYKGIQFFSRLLSQNSRAISLALNPFRRRSTRPRLIIGECVNRLNSAQLIYPSQSLFRFFLQQPRSLLNGTTISLLSMHTRASYIWYLPPEPLTTSPSQLPRCHQHLRRKSKRNPSILSPLHMRFTSSTSPALDVLIRRPRDRFWYWLLHLTVTVTGNVDEDIAFFCLLWGCCHGDGYQACLSVISGRYGLLEHGGLALPVHISPSTHSDRLSSFISHTVYPCIQHNRYIYINLGVFRPMFSSQLI